MLRLSGPQGTDALLSAGYQKIVDHRRPFDGGYVGTYQKVFPDEHGRRYFINVEVTRLANLGRHEHFYAGDAQFVRFRGTPSEETFNVVYFASDKTIDQMELFFEEMFRSMRVDRYDARDD